MTEGTQLIRGGGKTGLEGRVGEALVSVLLYRRGDSRPRSML